MSSFSKVILLWGKPRNCKPTIWAVVGAESAGWFDVLAKNSAWDVMLERVCYTDEAANHQFPIAAAFWIIWIVSMQKCSSLTQNVMQICSSPHSVILNATATQYACSLNRAYHPHWPVQWSRHCSPMCIPVHSPWLPGYMDVAQTVLIILTMAGLLLEDYIYLDMKVYIALAIMGWCCHHHHYHCCHTKLIYYHWIISLLCHTIAK